MIPDREQLLYQRLAAKNLDQQFSARVQRGMGCSRFVAEALVRAVHEVYLPVLDTVENLQPGQMLFQCLARSNGSRTQVKDADMVSVKLTVDAGPPDQSLRRERGVEGLRRMRIVRMCNEAAVQGGLLTVEDLAYRLLNVGQRTIVRDLALIRREGDNPPLRSTVKDIGRTISHKAVLVKNWLKGDELSDLQRKYHHSFSAIENYLNTFKRVIFLNHEGYAIDRIAYMQKISAALTHSYLELWRLHKAIALPHRLRDVLEPIGRKATPKKTKRRAS
jgi:hypothetical protein